ncbi:hypothetical protein [Persicitalea sp.]|uniref:hypothetical protein n=1 Tax=Persicitalea sp. TaxID=3100273 RepID=UPI003593530F
MKNLCFLFLNLSFLCFTSFGQTNVSGNVSGTWTKANSPYIITSDVTVPAGQTLTIQPGVVVQSDAYNDDLLVYGTLLAQGTAADSIRFRGVFVSGNSTHGGTLFFLTGSSSSILDYVAVDRMGDSYYEGAAVYIANGETPTIRNTVVRSSELNDFKIWAGGARNFASVKAVVSVDRGTGGSNAIMPKLGYGSYYRLITDITVGGGQTLTVQPGVVVQSDAYNDDLLVYGTLLAQGTAADSIRFRGVFVSGNSTHGGTIYFHTGSSGSVLDYVVVERMGDTYYEGAAIYVDQGETPTIRNTVVRSSERHDFKIWAGGARNFSNLRAIVDLDRGTGGANATMPKLGYGSYYRLITDITVGGGQTLTIQPGVVVQSADYSDDLRVYGTLLAQGTAADSIHFRGVFVSTNSSHGGTIYFHTGSSGSVLDYVVVDRMGDTYYLGAAISLEASCTIKNTTVKNSELTGIYTKQGSYVFNNCSIYANATWGVYNASTVATDIVDARNCYWGNPTGPYHPTLNPSGTGNKVTDKVLFNPWSQTPGGCMSVTVKSGNWNDPTVWLCGQVPSSTDLVVIRHAVALSGSFTAHAKQVAYETGGSLNLGTNSQIQLGN